MLSLPLLLRFDEGYRYRLDGTARVDGYDCYVVRFEPLKADASLYRGTVWVDRKTFARIRVQAVQGGLAAPVVSNEEMQRYTPPITVGNQAVYPVQRPDRPADHADRRPEPSGREEGHVHAISGSTIPAFEDAREAARASDHVMFRETDRGLRYYVKQEAQPRGQRPRHQRARRRWRWA